MACHPEGERLFLEGLSTGHWRVGAREADPKKRQHSIETEIRSLAVGPQLDQLQLKAGQG